MLHYWILALVLYVFWLLLSGQYSILFFCLGAVSMALVILLQKRMDTIDKEPIQVHIGLEFIHFTCWLIGELIRSNLQLARIILDPKMPVKPVWKRLDVSLTSPAARTLYANTITLTPGTLTTDVKENYFLIHTLNSEFMQDLETGEMEERIRKLNL